MIISEERLEELKKEREELVARYQEYATVMKNIETRVSQIDGIFLEAQKSTQVPDAESKNAE